MCINKILLSHIQYIFYLYNSYVLLYHVFVGSVVVREVVFADSAGDAALQFLGFPESVAKSKRSPEKLFRLLDLYDAVTELRPEIELIFSFDSTAAVRAQALASLSKLAETASATLTDFESAITKESSRSTFPGGGVHPMTRYAMNYISLLADYQSALVKISADFPIHTPTPIPAFFFGTSQAPTEQQPAPASSSSSSEGSRRSAIAARFAWLILSLLCKLDEKAAAYRDVGLSYLFLANNLQYIVNKVRSCRLRELLGEEWATRHAAKARQHAAGYDRAAWGRVAATIPTGNVSAGEARGRMRAFNAALEEACAAESGWVVADAAMREEMRANVRRMILPAYRGFYTRWGAAMEDAAAVLLSPDDVGNRVGELFSGSGSHRTKASSSRTV
ncbi:exocyst complex [Musa troglodytarum]|uniref:Exocyst subunit Exo70 family protein n=1 Tax=Musa troglodytarum TaxID=320322 RepID=A0A9E7L658_9LILI|nr:exocyst complex [Musa troglodytarum]